MEKKVRKSESTPATFYLFFIRINIEVTIG